MKNCLIVYSAVIILLINFLSSQNSDVVKTSFQKVRPLKDTIGFAQYSWQMDSLMARMGRTAIATDCHWAGYAALGYR